jgi:hypothetical protein
LRRIPVQLARGWGGVEASSGHFRGMAWKARAMGGSASPLKAKLRRSLGSDIAAGMSLGESLPMASIDDSAARQADLSELNSVASAPPAPAVPPPPSGLFGRPSPGMEPPGTRRPTRGGGPGRELMELLALQMADGGFEDGPAIDELLKRIGCEWDAVRALVEPLLVTVAKRTNFDAERLARTATVRFLLRRHFPSRAALWERADKKAARYLVRELGTNSGAIDSLQSGIASAILPPAG